MNFEEALQKLEKITQALEEGNLPLEESLKKFEEGMELINFCEKKLEEVEKRISVLTKEEGKLKIKIHHGKEKKAQEKQNTDTDLENGFLFEKNNNQ